MMDDMQELTPSWKWLWFKITATPCHFIYRYQSFGNTCWFQLHGRRASCKLWDFRFSQQWLWGFRSSGIWCRVIAWMITDSSEKYSAFMEPLTLEDWGSTVCETSGTTYRVTQYHTPEDLNTQAVIYCCTMKMKAAGFLRRPWNSYLPLWEPQISHDCGFFLSVNYFVVSNLYYVYHGNCVYISAVARWTTFLWGYHLIDFGS
jgi:hypothetical protein